MARRRHPRTILPGVLVAVLLVAGPRPGEAAASFVAKNGKWQSQGFFGFDSRHVSGRCSNSCTTVHQPGKMKKGYFDNGQRSYDDEDAARQNNLHPHRGRRSFLLSSGSFWLGSTIGIVSPSQHAASAAEQQQQSSDYTLRRRVLDDPMTPPSYGMEGSDVFYPSWLAGTWTVDSETTNVQAPCGVALFGGNATYASALNDIGQTLRYSSRFLPVVADNSSPATPTTCIADREYNVKSIARAAMGGESIVNVALATPNKFSVLLAPTGSPSLLRVDLIALGRKQETVDADHFDCSEIVREIVARVPPSGQESLSGATSPIIKEVETTSLYTYHGDSRTVTCKQRSASFLVPSQTNPVAMQMWQASHGRPVDVRFYDTLYRKASSS